MPDERTSPKTSSATGSLKLEVPTRSQPNRGNKSYVLYYGIGSESSSDENIEDRTHSDSEYVQPKSRGKIMQCTFVLNISRELPAAQNVIVSCIFVSNIQRLEKRKPYECL